jgi:hypothetical protein
MVIQQLDNQLVDIIINHPDVRPTVEKGDHYITSAELFNGENIIYGSPLGAILFVHKGGGVYEGHIAFLPQGRGKAALQACSEALDHLFREHKARKVVASIPLMLRPARFLVRRLGFASEGVDPAKSVEHFVMEAESWAV